MTKDGGPAKHGIFNPFHDWKITKKGKMSEELAGTIRKCRVCGKRQKLDVHCLGMNPPKYVETWIAL